jgi:hypothetical protein
MRQLLTNISNVGININGQGIALIVRNEVVRPLRATLSALRWFASRLSDSMRDARWHGLAMATYTAKQPARCFAAAKQHERTVRQHVLVTARHRSVA